MDTLKRSYWSLVWDEATSSMRASTLDSILIFIDRLDNFYELAYVIEL